MSGMELQCSVARLLYLEAALLDDKKWQQWLDLYTEDAIFWMPAWANEHETTSDPERELNLLYLKGRSRLEDRVFRLQTGDSFASVPMARTTHVVGNVLITGRDRDQIDARASWIVHSFGFHGPLTRSGSYEYQIRQRDEVLKIAQKKVTIIDDKLVGPVDVFHV